MNPEGQKGPIYQELRRQTNTGTIETTMDAVPRLKAEIWVKALIRRAETGGAAAMVVRRGDATSGTVLVKVSTLDGEAEVFSPARDGDGALIWLSKGRQPEAYREAAQLRPGHLGGRDRGPGGPSLSAGEGGLDGHMFMRP